MSFKSLTDAIRKEREMERQAMRIAKHFPRIRRGHGGRRGMIIAGQFFGICNGSACSPTADPKKHFQDRVGAAREFLDAQRKR